MKVFRAFLVAFFAVGLFCVLTYSVVAQENQQENTDNPASSAEATENASTTAQIAPFSPSKKLEIRGIIKDYLLENPEILKEMFAELEKRDAIAERQEREEKLEANHEIIYDSSSQVTLGNLEGTVTVVEFFDYNCVYCETALKDVFKLVEEYKEVRLVLKEFPILNRDSLDAARVSVAVWQMDPDKFKDFHLQLFEAAKADKKTAIAIARKLGIKTKDIEAKLDIENVVNAPISESHYIADQLGINSTPTFIINGEYLEGAVGFETLSQIIQKHIKP